MKFEELLDKEGKLDNKKVSDLVVEKPLIEPISKEKFFQMSVKINRDPYIVFPERLPTTGKLPLPVDEHEHIGMYEHNQTLYLTIANAYNKAMERIEQLEQEIIKLKNGK